MAEEVWHWTCICGNAAGQAESFYRAYMDGITHSYVCNRAGLTIMSTHIMEQLVENIIKEAETIVGRAI